MRLKIELSYDWAKVQRREGSEYSFPDKLTEFMKEKYSSPAVYRWVIERAGCKNEVYIGETENLYKRLNGYISPGEKQATNTRINNILRQRQNQKLKVNLEVLQVDYLKVGELSFSKCDLGNLFLRKFIECLMLVICEGEYEILNKKP